MAGRHRVGAHARESRVTTGFATAYLAVGVLVLVGWIPVLMVDPWFALAVELVGVGVFLAMSALISRGWVG